MGALLRFPDGSLAIVLGVVLLAAYFPQVRTHGLFTIGLILLRREVDLVLRDLREIFLTSLHSSCYSGEACACIQLLGRQRTRTLVRSALTDVQAGAVRVLRCSGTVGTDQVVTADVAVFLLRFCQGTLYILDTRRIGYFSHSKLRLT